MTAEIDFAALAVFLFLLGLVMAMGFMAARWRRPKTLANLDEWGLGGRQFGTWITWFLIGGDIYTAYTMIAVPALVYAVGAYGFFAIPYTIIVYPFVFAVMPILWQAAKDNNHVTAADVVYGRYGYRPLELAVALTGVFRAFLSLPAAGLAKAARDRTSTAAPTTSKVLLPRTFIKLPPRNRTRRLVRATDLPKDISLSSRCLSR